MMEEFTEGGMREKYGSDDSYQSGSSPRSAWPSILFYGRLLAGPFRWLGQRAAQNCCDDFAWVYGSAWCGDLLEGIGGKIRIDGMRLMDQVDGPCVFIANHMSTLETFLLPAIIRPKRPMTFVVKESLCRMPVFGPIMRSRDPIVVGRKNPREDLSAVLEGGCQRLSQGISIVVFPQSTRSLNFDKERFNSIGVKLAKKAGVAAIPLALKTDAWGMGRRIKEIGRIRPDLPARFKFAQPMRVEGAGKAEHAEICRFIGETLAQWQKEDGVNI